MLGTDPCARSLALLLEDSSPNLCVSHPWPPRCPWCPQWPRRSSPCRCPCRDPQHGRSWCGWRCAAGGGGDREGLRFSRGLQSLRPSAVALRDARATLQGPLETPFPRRAPGFHACRFEDEAPFFFASVPLSAVWVLRLPCRVPQGAGDAAAAAHAVHRGRRLHGEDKGEERGVGPATGVRCTSKRGLGCVLP